jgi:hypothetical protein
MATESKSAAEALIPQFEFQKVLNQGHGPVLSPCAHHALMSLNRPEWSAHFSTWVHLRLSSTDDRGTSRLCDRSSSRFGLSSIDI